MTRRPTPVGAALVCVVLATVLGGCAPAGRPAPSVPATLPVQQASPATVGPTAAAQQFAPSPVPTGRTGIPVGGLPPAWTLTSADPDVVAVAGLPAYYRADTALDLGPVDTHRRALAWTTGQLTAGIRGDRPVTGPAAAWTVLTAHHGYTTVTVTRAYHDGAPIDSRTTVHREFAVTITPRGRDGWTGPPVACTDFLTLTRTAGGWRVTALQGAP